MTDDTRPRLDHAPDCQRRRAPLLIAGPDGHARIACPECNATTPADDQRTRPERTPNP